MHRAAAPALLAAVLLLACGDASPQTCPGVPVARFSFTGVKVAAGDPSLGTLDPVPAIPDCGPQVGPPSYPASIGPFEATLAADPSTQAATLCRETGIVLYGDRSGSRYEVEGGTEGAVLASCSPTCDAAMRLVVAGDVIADATGAPASFTGVLVEVMSLVNGDCGACLPAPAFACAARYVLTGAR